MRDSKKVRLVVASRRPLALIAVLASALSMGQPDVARAEDFHWDARTPAEKPAENVARRPPASVKSTARKKPTRSKDANAPKAKPQ